jgi:hypothetical protein
MPGLVIPSEFWQFLANEKLVSFDDVGLSASIPPGVAVKVPWSPSSSGMCYILYYISFGDVEADVFNITCSHKSVFTHQCTLGYEVIDPGCRLWCKITKNYPYEVTVENTVDTFKTIKCRLWYLRALESDLPIIDECYRTYILGRNHDLITNLRSEIQKILRR